MDKTALINAALAEDRVQSPYMLTTNSQMEKILFFPRKSLTTSVDVEAVTLDDVLMRAETAPEAVGFCWIDTEGFDYICVQQIVNSIGTDVPIFTEISNIFEGKDAAQAYLTFLNKNYQNCYVFERGREPVLSTANNAVFTSGQQICLCFQLKYFRMGAIKMSGDLPHLRQNILFLQKFD